MYLCVYVCMHVGMCACMYKQKTPLTFTFYINFYIYIDMYTDTLIHLYIPTLQYIYIYIYLCVCMHIYTHILIYIYIHTYIPWLYTMCNVISTYMYMYVYMHSCMYVRGYVYVAAYKCPAAAIRLHKTSLETGRLNLRQDV